MNRPPFGQDPKALEEILRPTALSPEEWFFVARALAQETIPIGQDLDRLVAELGGDAIEKSSRNPEAAKAYAATAQRVFAKQRVFNLAAGYASENYLKGLWIARRVASGEPVDMQGLLPIGMSVRHDLVELAQEVGVTLSENETRILHRLSDSVVWLARYPVPKNAKDYQPQMVSPGMAKETFDLLDRLNGLAKEVESRETAPR